MRLETESEDDQFFRILAHRGASARYPENTLSAFFEAFRVGSDGVELDVQMSRDGVLMVCHDESLKRLCGIANPLVNYTAKELLAMEVLPHRWGTWGRLARPNSAVAWRSKKIQPLDKGLSRPCRNAPSLSALSYEDDKNLPTSWHCITTLEDYFDLLDDYRTSLPDDFFTNIELKNALYLYDGMEQKLIDFIYSRGLESEVILSSFNPASILQVHTLAPEIKTGLLDDGHFENPATFCKAYGAMAWHPRWSRCCPERVSAVLKNNLQINAWTVNTEYALRTLVSRGVSSVITNYPENFIKIRTQILEQSSK